MLSDSEKKNPKYKISGGYPRKPIILYLFILVCLEL